MLNQPAVHTSLRLNSLVRGGDCHSSGLGPAEKAFALARKFQGPVYSVLTADLGDCVLGNLAHPRGLTIVW